MVAAGVLLSFVGAGLQIWLLWFSHLPLGIPGEWVWPRVPNELLSFQALLPALLAGIVPVGYLIWTSRDPVRTERTGQSSVRSTLWLAGLVCLGCIWTSALMEASPVGGQSGRAAFVLYYPRTSGYFFQARYEAEDLASFLAEYETEIRDPTNPDNYLHIGTHPPGLSTVYRLLIELCQSNEQLTRTLMQWQPESVSAALQVIQRAESGSGRHLKQSDLAALWLAILLSQFLAVLTVVPLYFLARRSVTTSTARCVAVLWLFVPALHLFLPKSDAAFPAFTMLLQWLWLGALERNSLLRGALTALLFCAAASLSLAFATVALILFLQALWHFKQTGHGWRPVVSGVIAGICCVLALSLFGHFNLFSIWLQNLKNHAAFYDHNVRTYLAWLWVNPLEASIALGLPLAACSLLGCGWTFIRQRREQWWPASGALIWGVLWISGKNMGEAGRLWLFLMPYALLLAAPFLERLQQSDTASMRKWVPLVIVTLQWLVCLLTSIRIDAFGFTDF